MEYTEASAAFIGPRGSEWVEITQSARGIAKVLDAPHNIYGRVGVSTLSACYAYLRNRWFDAARYMTDKHL